MTPTEAAGKIRKALLDALCSSRMMDQRLVSSLELALPVLEFHANLYTDCKINKPLEALIAIAEKMEERS